MARRTSRRTVGGAEPPAGSTDVTGARNEVNPDPEPDPEHVAHTICLRLLTVRARTRAELAEALQAKNVPDSAAGRVLGRLADVGLINDAAFANDFVRSRTAERGLARREVARQLRSKGVDDSIVEDALASIEPEAEYETARRLAERKFRSMRDLEPQVQTRRLAGMLARKGYSAGLAFQVVRAVVGEAAAAGVESDSLIG